MSILVNGYGGGGAGGGITSVNGDTGPEVVLDANDVNAANEVHTHGGSDVTGFTADRVLVSDTDGDIVVSSITTTKLDYLNDVTGDIQAQLTGKISASVLTTNGDILVRLGGTPSRLGIGTDTYVLTMVGGLPAWAAPAGGGITIGTTAVTGGGTTRLLYEASGVVQSSANLTYDGTKLLITTTAGSTPFETLNNGSGTSLVVPSFQSRYNSSGTPAAGFGSSLYFYLKSSTTSDQTAGTIEVSWTTATHASRTSKIAFTTVNSGTQTEKLSINGDGTWTVSNVATGTAGWLSVSQSYQNADSVGLLAVVNAYTAAGNYYTFTATKQTGGSSSTVQGILAIRTTSGATNGHGAGLDWKMSNSSTHVLVARIASIWNDATNQHADVALSTAIGGVLTERLRIVYTGVQTQTISTANTNTVQVGQTIITNSTGTTAAGYGSGIKWQLKDATTISLDAAQLDVVYTAVNPRTAKMQLSLVVAAAALAVTHTFTDTTIEITSGSGVIKIGGNQVLGARSTGWTAWTGTADKTTHATYDSVDIDATYNESQMQALSDGLQNVARGLKAVIDAGIAHGFLGT